MSGLDAVPSDLHGSSAYRTRVGAAMVARAWTRAVEEAAVHDTEVEVRVNGVARTGHASSRG